MNPLPYIYAFVVWLFGYVTEERALSRGMTHHASYHGLAIYIDITERAGGNTNIIVKYDTLEWLVPVIVCVEQFVQLVADTERGFMFLIKDPINPPSGADRAR